MIFEKSYPIKKDCYPNSEIIGILKIFDENIAGKFERIFLDLNYTYLKENNENRLIELSFQPFRFGSEGNCLDKQRVKEAIEKIFPEEEIDENGMDEVVLFDIKKRILKELNL